MLSREFVDMLVCPESQKKLVYFPEGERDGFLLCEESRLRYPVKSDIPVMLLDQAERLSPEMVAALLSGNSTSTTARF